MDLNPSRQGAVCFVAGGDEKPDGPVCIGERRAARALTASGRPVYLLWCGPAADRRRFRGVRRELEAGGVGVSRLDEIPLPAPCRADNGTPGCGPALYRSNLIRYALESLHRDHGFGAVVFPSLHAAGFRCVQAKRTGTAFAGVNLVVRLDCLGQWQREAEKRWPVAEDLFLDYAERYTLESADIRIGSSPYMLEQARRLGWDVPSDVRQGLTGTTRPGTAEVVLVGGLEADLDLFLGAVDGLDPSVPLAFLNPASSSRIASRMNGRRHTILYGLDRGRTLEYLADGERLAVVCGRSETIPPLVRDCLVHGLAFVAARPDWLPGLVTDAAVVSPPFFEAGGGEAVQRLGDTIRAWCDRRAGADSLDETLQLAASRTVPDAGPALPAASPAATLAVTYYNLGRYLPETLASLAVQTCPDLEVLVIDDGSTCEESRRVWDEQRRLYPQFRFVRQPNAGLGAARNRALREARGEFFIPVDADNIAAPEMAAAFVRAMRCDPGASAMTCFFAAFQDLSDIEKMKFPYQCCPTGGPHVAACAYNVYGDANAVFRTADLRAAGGFVEDRSTYCHDWETFVKLAQAGRRISVVPEYLFYYRLRPDSLSAVMTRGGTDTYAFAQRMLATFGSAEEPADVVTLQAVLAGMLLQQARREPPPGRWSLRRLLGGAARRVAAFFRPAATAPAMNTAPEAGASGTASRVHTGRPRQSSRSRSTSKL